MHINVHFWGSIQTGTLNTMGSLALDISDLAIPSWLAGLAITIIFAVWARMMRAVTRSGAIAGGIMAFAIYAGGGPGGFAVLVAVFFLTAFTTHWRREVKAQSGRSRQEERNAGQVLANLLAAALVCAAVLVFPAAIHGLLPAAIAALAEAAADTVSSETGEGFRDRTLLITSFQIVAPGKDGGISFRGTLAGALAAIAVGCVALITGVLNLHWAMIAAGCGVAGMLFDSVLGATLETRGLLGNDSVNFASTVFAADVALLMVWLGR